MLLFERSLRFRRIRRNPHHLRILFVKVFDCVAKLARLYSSTRSVGLGEKVKDNLLASERTQIEVFGCVALQMNGRSRIAFCHSFCFSNSLTAAGLAWPFVAFITWPTKNF